MVTIELLAGLRPEIADVARRYGASNLRLFGSAARGEDGPQSDIDLLVEIESGRTLLDLVGLEQDLTDLIGRKVDIVVEGGVNRHLEPKILSEAVTI
ncbi:MAG: nucleotidyltransferase family protein [Fimbriimonadaceae bacterium]